MNVGHDWGIFIKFLGYFHLIYCVFYYVELTGTRHGWHFQWPQSTVKGCNLQRIWIYDSFLSTLQLWLELGKNSVTQNADIFINQDVPNLKPILFQVVTFLTSSINVNVHCINYKKKNWITKRRFDLMPPGPIPRRVNVGFSPYVNYRVRFSNLGESHKISLRNKRQQQQSSHQLHMCTPIKKQPCWL